MLEDLSLHGTPQRYAGRTLPTNPPPPQDLQQLDLQAELLDNYVLAKSFLQSLMSPDEDENGFTTSESPNQIAAVINSVKGSLAEIIKMQTDVYNADRFKQIEQAMVSSLKLMPEDARQNFLDDYERILNNVR